MSTTEQHYTHPDPAVRELIAAAEARGAAKAVDQVVGAVTARTEGCARAGGGIYTRDFVAGLAHAKTVIRETQIGAAS